MAVCESDGFTLKTLKTGQLKNQDLLYIDVVENLSSCAKIDTRKIDEGAGNANISNLTGSLYNAANVPDDKFGCSENKCANTGTYQGGVTTAGEEVVIGDFKKTMDGSIYAAGIVTAYVLLPDGDHEVSLDIANYTELAWNNYNTIKKTVHATQGGTASALYPVVFDLADLSNTTGTGWTAGTVGVKLRVRIAGTNLAVNDRVGVSSFAFYEGLEDLEIVQTMAIGCINTWGDSQNFDVVEAGCSHSDFNRQSGTMTFTVTANNWTPNIDYINPTWHKSEEQEAGIPHIVTRKVVAGTGDYANYGVIQVSDIAEGSCAGIIIQTPGCANNSYSLTRISSPVPVDFTDADSDKFQVLDSVYNGELSLGVILISPQWIGQELNVIYRQKQEVDVSMITDEFREFKARLTTPFRREDGVVEYHVYKNILVTALGTSISRTDSSTREFQFTVAADENGVKKEIVIPR